MAVRAAPVRCGRRRAAAVPGGRGERAGVGFVIGEVRDWNFGSAACGWVFAIDVRPDARPGGRRARLLAAICAGFRRAGVTKVRTMLARDNTLILSFFRSQGMMAGPFIRSRWTSTRHSSPPMKLQKNTRLARLQRPRVRHRPTRHVSAAEIAAKYDVSPHHLAKVLSELARVGVVSRACVGGGYASPATCGGSR